TGWTQGEASGKALSEVLRLERGPFAGSIRHGKEGTSPADEPAPVDVVVTRDGSRIPVDVTSTALRTEDSEAPQGGVVVVRDISARREAEEAVQAYADRLQRLARVGLEIISAPPGEVLQVVTDCARRLIGCRLAVTSFSRTGWRQAIHAVSVADEELREEVVSTTPLDSEIYGLVCRNNEPLRLTEGELDEHPAWSSFRRRLPDCRGWLAAPLVSPGGDNLGLIQLSDRLEGEFEEQDEVVLMQMAQLASAAISNARLFEKTQRALEARDYVVAVVSHDLRSPLSAISANTELLRRTVEDDRARRRVETIERGVSRMEGLLEDLLQASRLALGESFPVEPVFVGVSALLEEVEAAYRPVCEESSVTFVVRGPDPGLRIEADRERLLQALDNLLGNALEVSPPGSVVRLVVEGLEGRVRFAVEDEGPGIDPADLGEIFEPFRQSETVQSGASGLGLAISKGIVASHGGEIWAENRPEGGARLVFEVPVRQEETGQEPGLSARRP
ncbi:MAG: ATP-binding protein, partial [Thermoanaerobaculia bacterium]|nr:ATP-binding protein [Thermoanaerobaculia bacterium]